MRRWLFKITSGPLDGQSYPVQPGLTIGRQDAEISLQDSKVSSVHARVVEEGQQLVLIDNESKNGIRVGGERVTEVVLKPGVCFQIGDSDFEVIEAKAKPTVKLPPPREDSLPPTLHKPVIIKVSDPTPAAMPEPPKKKGKLWNEALADFIEKNAKRFKDKPKAVEPLDPALVLDFVRGTQAQSRWVIGYGPRQIGSASLDLPIWEPGAPPVCFEIFPSAEGLLFSTDHPDVVLLNGEKVDSGVLRMGDRISILDTLIEVDFET